jgi:hypothetical protein
MVGPDKILGSFQLNGTEFRYPGTCYQLRFGVASNTCMWLFHAGRWEKDHLLYATAVEEAISRNAAKSFICA